MLPLTNNCRVKTVHMWLLSLKREEGGRDTVDTLALPLPLSLCMWRRIKLLYPAGRSTGKKGCDTLMTPWLLVNKTAASPTLSHGPGDNFKLIWKQWGTVLHDHTYSMCWTRVSQIKKGTKLKNVKIKHFRWGQLKIIKVTRGASLEYSHHANDCSGRTCVLKKCVK